MPQAKRSTSTRSRSRFKEPAALKRLTTSLDTAQKALAELSKGSGRDVGKGASDIYKDLRGFVSSARRDSGKVAKALQREFDQAQKQLAKAASTARSGTSRSTSSRSTSGSTSSRSSSSRGRSASASGTSARSGSSARSTSSRSTAGRTGTKRASSSGTKRSSGTTKRRSSKS